MGPQGAQRLTPELVLLAVCSLTWLVAILGQMDLLPLAGTFRLELYPLYSLASVLGWLAGNAYIYRRRSLPRERFRLWVLMSYLFGPPSLVCLLRTLAPREIQSLAPLVPVYAVAVYGIFFLVPVTLKVRPRQG